MVKEGPLYEFQKKRKEIKIKEAEKEGIPPTVEELLADPIKSNLLFIYLKNKNQDKLREKLIGRENLEKEEFEILEEARLEIKKCLDNIKEVLALLPIEYLVSISPDFAKIVNQIGIEKTRQLLENYLAELYMLYKDRFNELEKKINEIKNSENNLQNLNANLIEIAQKYGIPIKRLSEIYAKGGDEQELQVLVKSHLSFLGKVRDLISKGKFSRERVDELNKIDEAEKFLKQIDENLQEIGKMIASAIFETERGKELLSQELYGLLGKPQYISFREAGDLLKDTENEEKLNEEWQVYLKENEIEWDKIKNDNDKQKIKDNFSTWYRNKKSRGRKGGLLEYIFDKFLIGKINNFLNNIK